MRQFPATAARSNARGALFCYRGFSAKRSGAMLKHLRIPTISALSVLTGLFLAGCSGNGTEPVLIGGDEQNTPPSPNQPIMPVSGGPVGAAPAATQLAQLPPAPSETVVGERVAEIQGQLGSLQSRVSQQAADLDSLRQQASRNASVYYGQVGTLSARLQGGSPPANPRLVALIEEARGQLQSMAADVEAMTQLARNIADSASVANFLRESTIAAFRVPGAVEEDHEALADLQDAIEQLLVRIERQLTIARDEVERQSASVASEERNLRTLAIAVQRGGLHGGGPSPGLSPVSLSNGVSASPGVDLGSERPLVTIRFDRPNVNYDRALSQAINQALERAPGAAFEVVAVAPSSNGDSANRAQRRAESILRDINDMGVPASRLSLSAATSQSVPAPEVRVLIR